MKSGLIAYFRALHGHKPTEPDFKPPIRPEHSQPSPDKGVHEPASQVSPSQLPEASSTSAVFPTAPSG